MVREITALVGDALLTFSFLFDDCRGRLWHGTHLIVARLVIVAFSLHGEPCGDTGSAAEWMKARYLGVCLSHVG